MSIEDVIGRMIREAREDKESTKSTDSVLESTHKEYKKMPGSLAAMADLFEDNEEAKVFYASMCFEADFLKQLSGWANPRDKTSRKYVSGHYQSLGAKFMRHYAALLEAKATADEKPNT